jgi:hypothetical protein
MYQRCQLPFAIAFVLSLMLFGGTARAEDIGGVIPVTKVIFENSRLISDVHCLQLDNGPCIQFGAPGIKLELNGFMMTGVTATDPIVPVDPPADCSAGPLGPGAPGGPDGIAAVGQNDIVIHGPGLIQKFRRHGIYLSGLSKATVKRIVSHHNCFSGLLMGGVQPVTESLVEEIVSVRNASGSGASPCGGTCITNSHNNRIRRSEFAGTGSLAPGAPTGAFPNDFGVGLIGTSSGNIIEENGIGGNINGVLLAPLTKGNVIRKNVIAGNPPVQFGPVGADVRDFSGVGANMFEENLCITYTGASPSPCTKLPQFAGHQNN